VEEKIEWATQLRVMPSVYPHGRRSLTIVNCDEPIRKIHPCSFRPWCWVSCPKPDRNRHRRTAPARHGLSPEASIATMQMPKGYRLEPVLTEPQIAEPVMIAFDGNGGCTSPRCAPT
jgi:hypothetical protein